MEGDGRGATALGANASLCDLQFFTQDLSHSSNFYMYLKTEYFCIVSLIGDDWIV